MSSSGEGYLSRLLARLRAEASERYAALESDVMFQRFCKVNTGRVINREDPAFISAAQAFDQQVIRFSEVIRSRGGLSICDGCLGEENCPIWHERMTWDGEEFRPQPCPKVIEARFRRQIVDAEVPRRFARKSLEEFKVMPGNREAYEAAMAYINGEIEGGLLLWGPVGTGKTHLVTAVLMEMLRKGESGFWCHAPSLLWRIRKSWDGSGESEYELLEKTGRVRHLVLDELGKDKPSEWTRLSLLRVIDRRYNEELPILATTNFSPGELADRLGDWNMSRLVEMCEVIEVKGEDYRLKQRRRV